MSPCGGQHLRLQAAPADPVSANPAVTTTAVRTPATPHCSTTSATIVAGTATTARSGTPSSCEVADLPGWRIDDTHRAVERAAEVTQDAPSGRRCDAAPDDDDVTGVQDWLQRAHSTRPITQVGVVLQEIVGSQVEMDVHGAVLEPAAVDQPDVAEHPLHADVVRECLRHQSPEPGFAGDAGEIFDQHGGDALLVMGVGDGKGHFGFLASWPGVVLTDCDQLTVGIDHQRHVVAGILLGCPPQLGLGDDRTHTEESEVARHVAELPVEVLQGGEVVRPRPGARGRDGRSPTARRARRAQAAASSHPACWHRSGRRPAPHTSKTTSLVRPDGAGTISGPFEPPGCDDGTMAERITVFLLDDHEIVRRGLRDLLEAEDDIVVVGEASTEDEAVGRVPALDPDVAVLDVRLQQGDGVSACREIRSRHPRTACLILTSFSDDEALFEAIMAGASGYVLKQIRTTDLVDAVRRVAAGQNLLDPAVTAACSNACGVVPRRTNGSPGSVTRSARCWHSSPRA